MKQKTFTQKFWNNEHIIYSNYILCGVGLFILFIIPLHIIFEPNISLVIMSYTALLFLFGFWILTGLMYLLCIFLRGLYFICKKGAK